MTWLWRARSADGSACSRCSVRGAWMGSGPQRPSSTCTAWVSDGPVQRRLGGVPHFERLHAALKRSHPGREHIVPPGREKHAYADVEGVPGPWVEAFLPEHGNARL